MIQYRNCIVLIINQNFRMTQNFKPWHIPPSTYSRGVSPNDEGEAIASKGEASLKMNNEVNTLVDEMLDTIAILTNLLEVKRKKQSFKETSLYVR